MGMKNGLLKELKEALFPSLPPSIEEEKVRRAATAHKIAQVQCRGNVSVQAGRTTTRHDVEAMRDEVLSYEYR